MKIFSLFPKNKKINLSFFSVLGLLALLLIFWFLKTFSASKTVRTATEFTARVNHLQKGLDISLWFRFPLDETDEYYANYISDDDLNFIKDAGFTHIRLSIAPPYIYDPKAESKINSHMLPFVNRAITKILSHNLAVVVDLHDEKKTFENENSANNLIVFWKNFAGHLSSFDSNNVYFELLNEPIFDGKEDTWLALQGKLVAAVRGQAPNNTIIATGANWGGIEGLKQVKPYDDKNVIYSFHLYEPSAFTHQGADWAGSEYPEIANLNYPADAINCKQVLGSLHSQGAKDLVEEYCDNKWNKGTLANFIQGAVDWSKSNKVPIWVGEFGVYCKQSPRVSKLQWISDVKDIFDQNNIGWTLWAYDDCFGLGATKEKGQIKYDKDVLQTLRVSQTKNNTNFNNDFVGKVSNWKNLIGATWQWQLSEPIDQSVGANVYDIDYEKNGADVISSLHAKGRKVICYMSAGSWENWRGDAGQFPQSVIGKDYINWKGEKWLDIRRIDTIGPIFKKRLDMCQQKGFDAVEPDNIHGYQEDTGFSLTYNDQLTFNKWIAQEAHSRGLLIGLKNDSEQVKDLLPYFDFAITEDCFQQGWCSAMSALISDGKPVFAAEYTDTGMTTNKFCSQAKQLQFNGILKHRELDSFMESCN